jgi:hypothetical protein
MLDPVLMSIATDLATKAASGLYDLVVARFRNRPDAQRALEAARGAAPYSPPVQALATRLAEVAAEDPEFDRAMRTWADHGGVVNQITGNVSGKVVQARDITGNISL